MDPKVDTDNLTDADLLEMKSRVDDELHSLVIAHSAVNQESEPGDVEELQKRVKDLQNQLLEESITSTTNELLLKRIQMGMTLRDSIFSQETDILENLNMRQIMEALEIVSEITRIHKETLELQVKLDSQRLANSQLREENIEMMQKLQSNKDKAQAIYTQVPHRKDYKRLKRELEVKCKSQDIYKNLNQLLIIGMGQDWILKPELREIMMKCGQPLSLS